MKGDHAVWVISLYASGAYQCCTHPHQVMNGIPMPSGRYHPRVGQFLKHPHQVMKAVTMPSGRYHPRACPFLTHPHQVLKVVPMPSGRDHPRVCQFLKHPHQVMKVVTMPSGRYHPRVCPSQRSMLQNHTSHRPICSCLSHLVLPQLPPPHHVDLVNGRGDLWQASIAERASEGMWTTTVADCCPLSGS